MQTIDAPIGWFIQEVLAGYDIETEDKAFYEEEASKIVADLYDLTKDYVSLFNIGETTYLRKRIGIYDDGVAQDEDSVARFMGLLSRESYKRHLQAKMRFVFYEIPTAKLKPLSQVSTITDQNTLDTLRKKSIYDYEIPSQIVDILRENNIITLAQLSCHGIMDLVSESPSVTKIVTTNKTVKKETVEKSYDKAFAILEFADSLGIPMIDNLTDTEKAIVLSEHTEEEIDSSSIAWIMDFYMIYGGHPIFKGKTVGDLRKFLSQLDAKEVFQYTKYIFRGKIVGIDLEKSLPKQLVESSSQPLSIASKQETLKEKYTKLTAERRQLLQRLSEIDSELGGTFQELLGLDTIGKEKVKDGK